MYSIRGRSVLLLVFLCGVGIRTITIEAEASYSIAQQAISNDCLFPQPQRQWTGRSDFTAAFHRTSTQLQGAARDAHRDEDETDYPLSRRSSGNANNSHTTISSSSSSSSSSNMSNNDNVNDNGSRDGRTSTENIPFAHGIPDRTPPPPPVESSDALDVTSTGGSSHEERGGSGNSDPVPPSHDAVLGGRGKPEQQQPQGVVWARSDDHENGSPAAPDAAKRAWEGTKVFAGRTLHLRREIKAVFSSELERCLLKATRPEDMAVDEACVQALLAQANRLSALEACFDCDPHEVMCSKLFKKMMEKDWRTVAKALYVVHRLERDSPPKDAARFAAFFKEKWADGAGELGRHVRREGGENAPWLKVYSGYLAARGRGMDTAVNAFRTWETLTSIRQLRNGLAEANALLARALALQFAGDASSPRLGGGTVRRACCGLAFQDAVDVRAMVCRTGRPPALIGAPGLGVDPSESEIEESVAGRSLGEDYGPADIDADTGVALSMGRKYVEAAGVTVTAVENGPAPEASARAGGVVEAEDVASDRSCPSKTDGAMEAAGDEDVVEVEIVPEDVLEAAKECAMFEEVSGVITAVYSDRYGSEERESGSATPLWVRQLAAVACRVGAGADGPHPPYVLIDGRGRGVEAGGDGEGKSPQR